MIETVIFDIGNVLIDFDWYSYVSSMYDDDTVNIIYHAIWDELLWLELDRGALPEDEVIERIKAGAPDYREVLDNVFDRVGECVHRTDYAIPWIREIKDKGYQVLYLSNYSSFVRRKNPDVLDFLPYMDGGVFSYQVHLLKPEEAMYQEICKQFDLVPGNCLFIDDNKDNIEAAEKFGLNTVHFQSYEDAHEKVNEILRGNQSS
ncbi:MAG: HAD family phosphatase [Lachnospiraceae bacterium]|nr:HAD family phosphatase [Lachnospiraceae bacterium]